MNKKMTDKLNTAHTLAKISLFALFLISVFFANLGAFNSAKAMSPAQILEKLAPKEENKGEYEYTSKNTASEQTLTDTKPQTKKAKDIQIASSGANDTDTNKTQQSESTEFNWDNTYEAKSIGDPNAPIKISEHSSFTCGHCGKFHQDTFKAFKENYVDTGKVYLTFSDFPLNAPALHASMISRCLPEKRYFDFIQFLFETQDKWAFEKNYLSYLKQNAQLVGLSSEKFNACLKNKDLQKAVLEGVQHAQKTYDVSSTPTLIMNGQKLEGNKSFEELSQIIETEMKAIKAQ